MKKWMLIVCLLFAVTKSAMAQIPVTDMAAVAKAIEQLTAWQKQYQQMLQQINLSKDHLKAMTGGRNLGAIVDNVATTAGVPQEVLDQWRTLTTHEQLLTEAMRRTKQALDTTQSRGTQVRALMNAMSGTADAKAAAELQGRISAEVAMVVNDSQRVQLMQIERQNNHERIIEQLREVRRIQREKPLATW